MTQFTPWSALAGGALIGAAAVILMAANGRIAGISGIVDGVLAPVRGEAWWRAAFLGGLVAAPLAFWAVTGAPPQTEFPHALPLIVVGGALVGYGSRLGGGCTSGHGVCGLARLSKRSIAATATFMATGVATVLLVRLVGGA